MAIRMIAPKMTTVEPNPVLPFTATRIRPFRFLRLICFNARPLIRAASALRWGTFASASSRHKKSSAETGPHATVQAGLGAIES